MAAAQCLLYFDGNESRPPELLKSLARERGLELSPVYFGRRADGANQPRLYSLPHAQYGGRTRAGSTSRGFGPPSPSDTVISAKPFTVSCPSCLTKHPVDPEKVPMGGVHAICSACLLVFPVNRPVTNGSARPALMEEVDAGTRPERAAAGEAEALAFEDMSSLAYEALAELEAKVAPKADSRTSPISRSMANPRGSPVGGTIHEFR